jgi:hydroxymethylglutaryl-CoA synthase
MAIEAARNALARADIDPAAIRAVWVGSESHPYAVKPTSAIVAQAIGAGPGTQGADWEFACKAGTEAMQAAIAMVGSGMGRYAMAIGMDAAQGQPGDALEYTAAAGGAAYILGPEHESIAIMEGSYSYVTDTPDFWRRESRRYPRHEGRFTGEPAYFAHTRASAERLLADLGRTPSEYDYAVFHQPNVRFPAQAASQLGFGMEQTERGLLVEEIGNAYAGSSMLGLSAVLDVAQPGQRILHVSFGSGAGSDAFSWVVTERIAEVQERAPATLDYVRRRKSIDYSTYLRIRDQIVTQ